MPDCCRSKRSIESLWEDFGDIPIDDRDNILEDFMGFPAGTNRFDIWYWFDKEYSEYGGVAALLYGGASE